MISLQGMIQRAVRLNPNGTATRYNNRQHSWSEVGERIARLAGALRSFGFEDGDQLALLSLNSDRYYETTFAVSWAGYCVVPLNTRWALPENSYAVKDSESRAIIFDDAFTDQTQQLMADIEALEIAIYAGEGECPEWAVSYEALIESNEPATASNRGDGDMAGIFYTGGTTGFPKGVMQSHLAIWASAMGALPHFSMTQESVYLHVAPMFHMADFAGSMGVTLCCATNVMLQSFDPGQVLRTLSEEKISHSLMVPAMIKMVLNHSDVTSADVSSLKVLMYGASPMPAATLEYCMSVWPNVDLVQAYGQTEMAPVLTTLSSADHREGGERLKSAGRPTAVVELRIVDEQGQDLPRGESGEISAKGPNAMIGYWKKSEETAKAMKDGWVLTGDAGYFDDKGYLFIVDRVKDMVVTGGENVFTTEVENAVISHDAIMDVAVIGIPHAEWGEAVHAIVVLHEGQSVTEEELITHCRELIAGYKLPKSVTFRGEPLPLSGAGKVLKTDLRKPYWEGLDRQVN